jgi:mono/diheme cytochrome c family protein
MNRLESCEKSLGTKVMKGNVTVLLILLVGLIEGGQLFAAEADFLRPRVPNHDLAKVRTLKNPFADKRKAIEEGRVLYHGKGFCVACHGADGRGITDVDHTLLKGALPTDFTDHQWQAARTDGEILWVLKHGSPGTAMAPFVPIILSEHDAWKVIVYLRSLDRL